MTQSKKIVMTILALLPLLSLLAFVIGNIGTDAGFSYIPMGSISVADGLFVYEPDTWTSRLLSPLDLNSDGALMQTMRDLLINFNNSIGLPLCLPTVLAFWYLLYLFVLYLFDMLVSLLAWIPKKIGVILQ